MRRFIKIDAADHIQHPGEPLVGKLPSQGFHMHPGSELNDEPRGTKLAQESHEGNPKCDARGTTTAADRGLLNDYAVTCASLTRRQGCDAGAQYGNQFVLRMRSDQALDGRRSVVYITPEHDVRGDLCKPCLHWRQNRGVKTTMSENSSRRPNNIATVQTQV